MNVELNRMLLPLVLENQEVKLTSLTLAAKQPEMEIKETDDSSGKRLFQILFISLWRVTHAAG